MEGSVENISLGKEIGKDVRKNYNTDPKPSPILSRRNVDHMNGNIVNTTSTAMRLDNEEKATLQGLPDISMDFNMHDGYSEIACSLGNDFVNYKCGRTTSRPPSIYAETLRRVGDEIEEKYNISLNGIVNQLKYDPNTDGKKAFYASLDAMFEEGPCSWGRVVMVYVFAARLAKYCQRENMGKACIDDLIKYSGDYVSGRLTQWIRSQGGWGDFCEKFKAKDWRDKAVFNSLLLTGLFLGGMATLRLFTK